MDLKNRVRETLDRMADNRADPRIAWLILFGAMLVSAVYCLYMTRGTTFTGDEIAWVSFSPNIDFRGAIEPHSGHLILVTIYLYKLILETIGSDYLTFRLLTLGAAFLAVTLLYVFTKKRVGNYVALAPCLVLLFFGNDTGNLLQGIGFTIMMAVALGMTALLCLERDTRLGDIGACVALTVAVVTFTLALPFLAGAIVAILITKERWRRIWIVAIPLAVYLAWRVWLVADDVEITNGEAHISSLLMLPSWTFQSISGILESLTGFNYNFTSGGWMPPGESAGPVLAVIFIVAIGWRIKVAELSPWFWVVLTIAMALFASQAVGWIPDVRTPATSRYLYPGAFVIVLVLAEAFRGYPVSRTAFISIWLLAFCGLATNIAFIRDSGNTLRDRAVVAKAEVTASNLVTSAYPYPPGAGAKPLVDLVGEDGMTVAGPAQEKYGGLGLSETDLLQQNEDLRAHVDSVMASAFGVGVVPVPPAAVGSCQRMRADTSGAVTTTLPKGGVVLKGRTAAAVSLRRFSAGFTVPAGTLLPGRFMRLYIPVDNGATPWLMNVDAPAVTVCEPNL